ncbi:MAG: hypothetical protein AB7G48_15120 [Nitrospiraceae bacterium]
MARAGHGFLPLVLSLSILVAGCASDLLIPPITGTTTVATFHASDYVFDGPEQLPAGQTVVRLLNDGQQPHHI